MPARTIIAGIRWEECNPGASNNPTGDLGYDVWSCGLPLSSPWAMPQRLASRASAVLRQFIRSGFCRQQACSETSEDRVRAFAQTSTTTTSPQ